MTELGDSGPFDIGKILSQIRCPVEGSVKSLQAELESPMVVKSESALTVPTNSDGAQKG